MSKNTLEMQWAEEERHTIQSYDSVDNSLRSEENYVGYQVTDELMQTEGKSEKSKRDARIESFLRRSPKQHILGRSTTVQYEESKEEDIMSSGSKVNRKVGRGRSQRKVRSQPKSAAARIVHQGPSAARTNSNRASGQKKNSKNATKVYLSDGRRVDKKKMHKCYLK